MSDINNAVQQPAPPTVPTTGPQPVAPYAPPAWLQSDPPAALDETATGPLDEPRAASQPTVRRFTVRFPAADIDALEQRAERLGASRSDLLRTLAALPIDIDLTAIRRAIPGTETLSSPLGPDLVLTTQTDQTKSLPVQAITDQGLRSIAAEIRAIGVNYNQSVRALNRILRKYGNHRAISQEEREELVALYERISKQNKTIYDRLKAVAEDVDALAELPSVNLTARAREAPIDKTEPERRHRVRGRRHGPKTTTADTASAQTDFPSASVDGDLS